MPSRGPRYMKWSLYFPTVHFKMDDKLEYELDSLQASFNGLREFVVDTFCELKKNVEECKR